MTIKILISTAVFFLMFIGVFLGIYLYEPSLFQANDPRKDSLETLKLIQKIKSDSITVKKTEYYSSKKKLDSLARQLVKFNDTILVLKKKAAEFQKKADNAELEVSKKQIELLQKRDSLVRSNYTQFAGIYDLKKMKTKNAAKIIDHLKPETAASILILSATQQ